ncbi:MAG: NAD-dependent epimerase/dehydratase family protein [Oscillochloris sp.]|nr:NAD-dependent epimerase/dehydratase family protein [Oscillochloris sp.]
MNHLITGGAGFIGCNLADTLLSRGEQVTILDDLSRPLTDLNLSWLQQRHEARMRFIRADVRDAAVVAAAIAGHDTVFHLASQVAVTTSVKDPRTDFEINALGTLNVLEAARLAAHRPIIFYASTNKVYGGMEEVTVVEQDTRYAYDDLPAGVTEDHLLDFHSPYGCSKGAADQYVRDYSRIYGLKTVVFRQSCIYGPRQMGVEDQGWAAHFVIAAVTGQPISIYGDGKQVRDMLYIDDLVAAYLAALERIDTVSGRIFNVGGGPDKALSIWAEFGPLLERLTGNRIDVRYGDWRPGDQPVYISAISKAERELGWRPQVDVAEGIARLVRWVQEHRALFSKP